jgi:asparagine synthetase B (glutamine-hydrolysing)
MHGHYYVAPLVKEKQILNGSGIDGIYGVYKDIAIVGRNNIQKFNDKRNKHLNKPNDDAMIYQKELFSKFGIEVLYPYRKSNILNYLMQFDYKKINSPKLKQITIDEFPEIIPFWRPRGSQQIMAGTRALYEELKNIPKFNGVKRVEAIYKCL